MKTPPESKMGRDGKVRPTRYGTDAERAERDALIRAAAAGGISHAQIARVLGVAKGTVIRVVHNREDDES